MQKALISGYVSAAPEMRYTPSGNPVTTVRVAVRVYDPSAETKERTCWWQVNVWGNRSETVNVHVQKGYGFTAIGRMTCQPWHRNDGSIDPGYRMDSDDVNWFKRVDEGVEVAGSQDVLQGGSGNSPSEPASGRPAPGEEGYGGPGAPEGAGELQGASNGGTFP